MSDSQAINRLQLIANSCSTEADIRDAVAAMDTDVKMKTVYELSVDEIFEDSKLWSLWFIDFVEANNIVNDYNTGTSRQEALVGVLLAASKMLEQQASSMARHEMQAQDGNTQWGMTLADSISDYAVGIQAAVSDLATASAHYGTVLKGRRMGWHFTDQQGNGIPREDTAEQLSLDLEEK